MTPEQIDLARRLVARLEWSIEPIEGDARDRHGVRWVGRDGPLPDLTDDATGGVLLGMLPPGQWKLESWPDGRVCVRLLIPDGRDAHRSRHIGATLAEAAARAVLACWEAADGR